MSGDFADDSMEISFCPYRTGINSGWAGLQITHHTDPMTYKQDASDDENGQTGTCLVQREAAYVFWEVSCSRDGEATNHENEGFEMSGGLTATSNRIADMKTLDQKTARPTMMVQMHPITIQTIAGSRIM